MISIIPYFPYILCFIAGLIGEIIFGYFSKIINKLGFMFSIPNFLGIIMGSIIINYSIHLNESVDFYYLNIIRMIALISIIYKISWNCSLEILKKNKTIIFSLAILPNLCDALIVSKISSYLFEISTFSSLALGFDYSGGATAILLPILLQLKENNYEITQELPDILLFALILDSLFSILGFSIFKGFLFKLSTDIILTIIKKIISLLIGIIFGIILGNIFKYICIKKDGYLFFIFSYCILLSLLFVLNYFHFREIGYIITLVSILIINKVPNKKITGNQIKNVWGVFKIFLFSFIGISINFNDITEFQNYKNILILISISLLIRGLIVFLITYSYKFNERIFIVLCWIPKALIQAALGNSILYEAKLMDYNNTIQKEGKIISLLSFWSIIICAPLGSLLLSKFGNILIKKINFSLDKEESKNLIV